MYVSVVLAKEEYYLVANTDDNCILGFESRGDGLRYYEDAYNSAHRRSHESSMSAVINNMFFQPSIIPAPDIEELKKVIGERPKAYTLRNVSGWMTGIRLPKEVGEKWWNEGEKPKLIDRNMV